MISEDLVFIVFEFLRGNCNREDSRFQYSAFLALQGSEQCSSVAIVMYSAITIRSIQLVDTRQEEAKKELCRHPYERTDKDNEKQNTYF